MFLLHLLKLFETSLIFFQIFISEPWLFLSSKAKTLSNRHPGTGEDPGHLVFSLKFAHFYRSILNSNFFVFNQDIRFQTVNNVLFT